MIIGSAWLKDTKDGKRFMSCVIELPIIGKLNFAMFKNEKKEKDNQPDYQIVWSAPRENKSSSSSGGGNPFDDSDVPF